MFWGRRVRGPFLIFSILAGTFIISLTYSIRRDEYVILTVISFLGLLFASYIFYRHASVIWKWKRTVEAYLDKLSRIKSHKIILTTGSLCPNQDMEENIEKWSEIKTATLREDFISLIGKENYFFPKKSMAEDDYNYLRDFVADRMKNGL